MKLATAINIATTNIIVTSIAAISITTANRRDAFVRTIAFIRAVVGRIRIRYTANTIIALTR